MIFTNSDGGARGNPGPAAVGVILRDVLNKSGIIKTTVKGGTVKLKLDKKIYLCGKADKIFKGRLFL